MPRLIRANQADFKPKPLFSAHTYSGTSVTDGSLERMTYSTIVTDNYSAWDNTNGYYVIPVSGFYECVHNINISDTTANWVGGYLVHNSTTVGQGWQRNVANFDYTPTAIRAIVECDVDDKIYFMYHGSYKAPQNSAQYNQATVQLVEFS